MVWTVGWRVVFAVAFVEAASVVVGFVWMVGRHYGTTVAVADDVAAAVADDVAAAAAATAATVTAAVATAATVAAAVAVAATVAAVCIVVMVLEAPTDQVQNEKRVR